ncbi:MAG TPA: tRNA (N6-threonylcarbamoyladenosine(37)-N6)-methyltransferase TrmO [Longimicrobiales bacterium]|nr:tRNA (N6-threonylcarbamoyladenosine(37)-N6)-methyltransferase TrmO [Longimicrobiales bacterium]
MSESRPDAPRYDIQPIGIVRSPLKRREDAPHQGWLGAPAAWIELEDRFADGLLGLEPGAEVDVVTWFHLSDRDILQVRPSHDPERRLRGVFATRAPVRPNPLGIHRVRVLALEGTRLHVEPLEAVDGTPVVDIKAALTHYDAD